jgi:lipoate synthase
MALEIGFKSVMSAPLVRSSYHAEELMEMAVAGDR